MAQQHRPISGQQRRERNQTPRRPIRGGHDEIPIPAGWVRDDRNHSDDDEEQHSESSTENDEEGSTSSSSDYDNSSEEDSTEIEEENKIAPKNRNSATRSNSMSFDQELLSAVRNRSAVSRANPSLLPEFAPNGGTVHRRCVGNSRDSSGLSPTESRPSSLSSSPAIAQRSKTVSRRKSQHPGCFEMYHQRCPRLCNRRAFVALVFSSILWLYAQSVYLASLNNDASADDDNNDNKHGKNRPKWRLSPQYFDELRNRRQREAIDALGTGAGVPNDSRQRRPKTRDAYSKPERPPQGCMETPWQKLSFPNCNEIHEIDLRLALRAVTETPRLADLDAIELSREMTPDDEKTARRFGYVGNGLWRTVWRVDPRSEGSLYGNATSASNNIDHAPAVLKIMKQEHPFSPRNYDRHRRDALVMETLASSPYVVSMYAFCGNSVLTEFAGSTLDDFLYGSEQKNAADKRGDVDHAKETNVVTRETPIGRVRLGLDVFRAVDALHHPPAYDINSNPWEPPIVHSDIQAKQYLMNKKTGSIKINDFNRCRFLPVRIDNNASTCPVRIPSAPGANRAPEEYTQGNLTEQIDVYSAANILYGIITGRRPYESMKTSGIRDHVKAGKTPPIEAKYRRAGTIDGALTDLLDRAYEFDPQKRIRSSEMVAALENLLVRAIQEAATGRKRH